MGTKIFSDYTRCSQGYNVAQGFYDAPIGTVTSGDMFPVKK